MDSLLNLIYEVKMWIYHLISKIKIRISDIIYKIKMWIYDFIHIIKIRIQDLLNPSESQGSGNLGSSGYNHGGPNPPNLGGPNHPNPGGPNPPNSGPGGSYNWGTNDDRPSSETTDNPRPENTDGRPEFYRNPKNTYGYIIPGTNYTPLTNEEVVNYLEKRREIVLDYRFSIGDMSKSVSLKDLGIYIRKKPTSNIHLCQETLLRVYPNVANGSCVTD
jgi:hypothetical protein